MTSKKSFGLTTMTLLALALGVVTGIIIYSIPANAFVDEFLVNGVFYVIGSGFIKLLKMLVVPLVFVSIVTGTMAIGDTKKLGKIGVRTISFYLLTTACAIIIALVIGTVLKPGVGLDMTNLQTAEVTVAEKVPLTTTLLNLIPDNPVSAMANGDIIPIIIFAIFVGIGILTLGNEADVVSKFFLQFNEIMLKITMMVMKFAPIGVFALVARTFSTLGFDALSSLLKYVLAVLVGLGIQGLLVYCVLLYLFTRLNPFKFLKKYIPIFAFAFSTASSNATIPISIETLEKDMGVSRSISSFTIPLGATINMDGTAIMPGIAVCFTAQAFGYTLHMSDYITVILTATLASIGTAGVPGVGIIMLSMVLNSVGLPIEAIGIIMGIDRIIDMSRTAINVMGDAICTTIIAKQENDIDLEVYNS